MDLIKIIGLIEALAKAYKEANADGKITLDDIPHFLPILRDLTKTIDRAQGLTAGLTMMDTKKMEGIRDGLKKIGKVFGG